MRKTGSPAAETAEEIARTFRQSRHVSRLHALVLGATRRRSTPNSAATLDRFWLSGAPQALEEMSLRVESNACHLRCAERIAAISRPLQAPPAALPSSGIARSDRKARAWLLAFSKRYSLTGRAPFAICAAA